MELVAIVDPAMVTWSKYNLDMKPTKELAEMYQVLMATLRFGEGFGSKHSSSHMDSSVYVLLKELAHQCSETTA